MTIRMLSLVAVIALGGFACKKKDDTQGAAAKSGGASAPAKAEPAPKGPPELTATDFFKDYNSLKGMEVMDKYGDGVVVSGTVKRTIEEMDGSLKVWLDAGNPNWVSLGFKDNGAAAKAKGVKAGDQVKAKCSVGGGMDKQIMNVNCELM